jgi:hypothetical protein
MLCKDCSQEYTPYHGKPGYINQCENCGARTAAKQPPLRMAKVSWENKHTPIIDLTCTNNREVETFNNAQRRFGTSVVKGFGQSAHSTTIASTDWGNLPKDRSLDPDPDS